MNIKWVCLNTSKGRIERYRYDLILISYGEVKGQGTLLKPTRKTGTNWSLSGCLVPHDTSALAFVVSGVTVELSGGLHTHSDIGFSSCLELLVCMSRSKVLTSNFWD